MQSSLETKTLAVGLMVGLAHIASGFAIVIAPGASDVAPLYTITHLTTINVSAFVLIVAGSMAVIGATANVILPWAVRVILFAPQQVLLCLHVFSISQSLVTGQYPDGYIPQGGGWFILADQIWAWVLAVSHSIWLAALIYGRGGWRT